MTSPEPVTRTEDRFQPGLAPEDTHERYPQLVCVMLSLAIIYLWVLPMSRSLWLDESLVLWTIRGGFGEIFAKAFVSLQSVVFCICEWLILQTGLSTEWVLRLPSLAAGLMSVYVLYRIGVEAVDRDFGLILASIFVVTPIFAEEVPDARPYSIAMLAHIGGLLWLFRWARSSRTRDCLLWIVCSAIAVHLHHLFLVALVLEGAFVLATCMKRFPGRIVQVLLCAFLGAVLLAPMIPQVLVFIHQGSLLSFAQEPGWWDFGSALLNPLLTFAVLATVTVEAISGRRARWEPPQRNRSVPALGALLWLVPVLVFFVISKITNVRLFVPRYLLPSLAGGTLVWGWLIRSIGPPAIRRLALVAVILIGVILTGGGALAPDYKGEDWRSAVRAMPPAGEFVIYPGLSETRRLDWLQVAERRQYFMAPVSAYRPTISQEHSYIVPFEFTASNRDYMQPIVDRLGRGDQAITIVARDSDAGGHAGPFWSAWLSEQLSKTGFRRTQAARYGRISLIVLRPAANP